MSPRFLGGGLYGQWHQSSTSGGGSFDAQLERHVATTTAANRSRVICVAILFCESTDHPRRIHEGYGKVHCSTPSLDNRPRYLSGFFDDVFL